MIASMPCFYLAIMAPAGGAQSFPWNETMLRKAPEAATEAGWIVKVVVALVVRDRPGHDVLFNVLPTNHEAPSALESPPAGDSHRSLSKILSPSIEVGRLTAPTSFEEDIDLVRMLD